MATKTASNRSFGLLLAAVFAVLTALGWWTDGDRYLYWLAAGVFFLLVSMLMPRLLLPLKRLWLNFGDLLGRLVKPIVLMLLYVLSIVPIGLLAPLFGKNFLALKRDPQASSYWIVRDPPGPASASLRNQW